MTDSTKCLLVSCSPGTGLLSYGALFAQAELAERDFTADRGEVIVISTGAVEGKVDVVSAQERKAAEDKNRHKCASPTSAALTTSPAPVLCVSMYATRLYFSAISSQWVLARRPNPMTIVVD